jgi:signal transduction histidine kinase
VHALRALTNLIENAAKYSPPRVHHRAVGGAYRGSAAGARGGPRGRCPE